MPQPDLQWALAALSSQERQKTYQFCKYYDGDHPLAYATDKFRSAFGNVVKKFADNLCPAVVDSLAERVRVQGFKSSVAKAKAEEIPSTVSGAPAYQKVTVEDPIGDACWDLWEKSLMSQRSNEIHQSAIKSGNAYCLIWPGADMQPEFWPQSDMEMVVEYDANQLGVLLRAAKVWWLPEEKKYRLNVYLVDRIEKYITRGTSPNGVPTRDTLSWIPFTGDNGEGVVVPNPYGRVPVFHFSNRRVYKPGISDLKDILPIQDALNKSVCDMLIAMEFASYKQRYIIGMEVEIDEVTGEPVNENVRNYGVDRMMSIPGERSEIDVGEFQATDLGQFRQVSADFRKEAATISGTPLHYFFITTGDFPSGEAIKSAEARFVSRIQSRHDDWGPIWGEALKFALNMVQTVPEDVQIAPLWVDSSPRSDAELADTAVKKKAVGVSRSQILKELGYTDDEIVRMLQEADALAQQESTLQAASKGPQDGGSANGAGGGTTASKQGATQARSQGRVPGVKS